MSDLKKLLKESGLDKVPLGELFGTVTPTCTDCEPGCILSCLGGCSPTDQPGGTGTIGG